MVVCKKGDLFRMQRNCQKEEDRKKYCEAKKDAKRIISMAIDCVAQDTQGKFDSCHDGCKLFRIVKERAGEMGNVIGVNCL